MDGVRLGFPLNLPIIGVTRPATLKPSFFASSRLIKRPASLASNRHDHAVRVPVEDESEEKWQNGNWVSWLRSLWKAETNEGDGDEKVDGNEKGCGNDECNADADSDDGREFEFSKLLWTVSLGEARLYAQIAYLVSLSYTIQKIKVGNLLKRQRLCFVTSSLEKKERVSQLTANRENQSEAEEPNSSSCPCEWFICDDNENNTRYFVIQGSESLASWQANLLFEPIQFEGMDAVVHRGIYEAAKVVYEQMLPRVHEHVRRHGKRGMIRLTGHSVGGSLGLLVNLMLLIRNQVPRSCLLPVVTLGAPWVMCGGDRLLCHLGLPRNHLQGITTHRDIIPRAFSCNYPTRLAHLLKALNPNFRNHPCLNNQNTLYAPMGELLILQPDAKVSLSHHLLPPGTGLYVLRSQASDARQAKKQTRTAHSMFLNTPHPLEILSDRGAYGAILRDHDVETYLTSIRSVIGQELKRVRRMRQEEGRQFWWRLVAKLGVKRGVLRQVKWLLDGGRERLMTVVGWKHMHLVVAMVLFPVRLLICNWTRQPY